MPTQDPLKRLKCAYDECHNDRQYYCFDHKLRLCSDCCDSLHYNCTVQAIRSKDELWNAVGLLHHFVVSLTKKAKTYRLMENIIGLADCMKHISGLFEVFEQEARIAMKKDQFLKFHLLIEEARTIKSDILGGNFGRVGNYEQSSNPILRLLLDSELVGLTYSKIGAAQKRSIRKLPEFEETVREVTTEFKDHIEAKTKNEIQEKTKEIEEKTEAKYQKQIQDLQEDSKNSEEKVKAVEKAVNELNNKVKEQQDLIGREQVQKEDFEKELSALTIQHNQLKILHEDLQKTLEKNQKELDQREGILKHVKGPLCEAMYKDIVGEAKTFDSNAKLETLIGNEQHRKLIGTYAQNKVKLPDIKRVYINSIKGIPLESLDQFLTHSIPDQLPLLCLNWSWEELLVGAKVMDGLKVSLPKITKEILFHYTEFQPSDLEAVFQNSNNSERLCLIACKLHIKEKMNFGTKPTKTTYLSFWNCGDSRVTMDWGSHPERFESILEAISRSPYKNSLQTLNIRTSNLSKSKVEEMLSNQSMSSIQVIQETPSPLSD
ncbi:unnamed protein product [Moneuplotes crassus]|uniref:Uncharacterized protein n=1 Tax=Euplotes crassus TaxID=5936 RepID=A0AAD1U9I8_EUPCR|nr:unnamed protein product [Moneuplotes crassus]